MSLKGLGTAEKAFTVPRTPQTRKFKHKLQTNKIHSSKFFHTCTHIRSVGTSMPFPSLYQKMSGGGLPWTCKWTIT